MKDNSDGTIPAPEPTADNPREHLTCPACRSLDSLDGTEDGQMFTPVVAARDERAIVAAVQRAQDRAADRVTTFAGSLNFVYLHSVWFAIWIAINVGLLGAAAKFDAFPFGLLTMIVSLEAIFLATFVMVSQNRQTARSDIRSQLGLFRSYYGLLLRSLAVLRKADPLSGRL